MLTVKLWTVIEREMEMEMEMEGLGKSKMLCFGKWHFGLGGSRER